MVRNRHAEDEHVRVVAGETRGARHASPPPPPPPDRGSPSAGRWIAALLVLALLAVGAWFAYDAWADDDEAVAAGGAGETPAAGSATETTPAAVGATAGEIADDAERFVGQWVSVSGEISRVLTANAFLLGGEEFVGDDELLVVGANVAALQKKAEETGPPAEDDIVGVMGPVRMFDLAEVERDLGTDLDDATFRPYDGRPVVLAQDVRLTPRKGAGEATAGDSDAAVVAVSDIAADPSRYRGGTVTVTGTVSEDLGPNVVRLDEKLVVVGVDGPIAGDVDDGDVLKVTGTVFSLDASEIRGRLGRDLPNAVITGLAGPVLVAGSAEKAG